MALLITFTCLLKVSEKITLNLQMKKLVSEISKNERDFPKKRRCSCL